MGLLQDHMVHLEPSDLNIVSACAQDEDRDGPRAQEPMMRTTFAKEQYDLTTSDITQIQGFRRKPTWGGGNNLTLYFISDLEAASIRKHGQKYFDEQTKAGKERSGVAAKEREAKEQRRLAKEKKLAAES